MRLPRPVYYSCLFSALVAGGDAVRALAQPARSPSAQRETREQRAFHIPAADASEALQAFSRQSGAALVYVVEQVRGVRTNGLEGRYAPREALERLVANTVLNVVEDSRTGALMIKRTPPPKSPAPPAGSVSGTPPSDASSIDPTKAMNQKTILASLASALLLAFESPAQTPTSDLAKDAVLLEPFSVTASSSYVSPNALGATRIATPVQDLPISINIITDQLVRDQGVFKIEDAVRYTSGVANVNRNDNGTRGERFVLRGFNSDLLLRNGVPYNTFSDTANVQQIEVVKGANSVLYGFNSPGGLVNIVTKQPLRDFRGEVRAFYGDFDFRRFETDLTGPLPRTRRVRYRLNGSYEKAGSWLANGASEQTFVNPVVAFDLTSETTITFDYEWRELTGRFQRDAYPMLRAPDGTMTGYAPAGRDFSQIFPSDQNTFKAENLEARIEHRFSPAVQLRVVGARTVYDQDSFVTLGFALEPGSATQLVRRNSVEQGERKSRNLFADLFLNFSLAGMTHRLDLGAQATDRENRTGSRAGAPLPAVNIYEPPTYFIRETRASLLATGPAAINRTESKNHSFFVIDQIRMFSDRLHALAGLRYDDLDVQGTNTTPQFGLTAKVRPGVNVFAVYSESFNPNAPRVRPATGEVFTFPAENGRGLDVGVKLNLLDAKFSATLAAFSVTKTNVVQSQATATPGFTLFMLSGEEKSEGVEFDLAARLSANYELVASYAYTDARITQSNEAAAIGLRLEGVAKNSVALWNKYRVPHGPLAGLGIGGGVIWRQGPIQHYVTTQFVTMTQDSYATVDAALTYRWKIDRREIDLALNVHNLTDEEYFDRRAAYASPRRVRVSASFSF